MKKLKKKKLKSKLKKFATRAGSKVVYSVLLLYYAYRRKETPKWAKASILGSLAYFLSPLDFIPDLTPFLGFTDDLSILAMSLTTVGLYINKEVKNQAKDRLSKWFTADDIYASVTEIDSKLKNTSE